MPAVSFDHAEAPLVLALDLGTSSFRALLYDRNGQAVSGSEVQLPHSLRTTVDGGAEADPDALVELLIACIDGCLERSKARAKDIAAVASSCFWHSLMGVDAEGEAVTPLLMWADRRSAAQANALEHELGPEVHDRVGAAFHSSYWPAKIRWLQETQPVLTGRVARWMGFAEYADLRLCGAAVASIAMASGTGMLDAHTTTWDPALLDELGVEAGTLPDLIDRTEPIAPLTRAFARRWPPLAKVPWYPSVGDGACANVGSGGVSPRRVALSLGTSGAMRVVTPIGPDGAFAIPRGLWGYRLDREHMVVGGATSNGGILLKWLRGLVGLELDSDTMAEVDAMAPDCHGLTVLPFVAGERFPAHVDSATGVIAGMTLATTPAAIVRAGMEAVAYRMGRIYERLLPLAATGHTIAANGGAILSSPALLQAVADTLGHEVIALPADEEASGRGAAILALHASGVIPDLASAPDPATLADVRIFAPNASHHRLYQRALARQALLEQTLFPDGPAWDAG